VSLIPADTIPNEVVITLSPAALWFATAISVLTALLCGLAPATHSARGGLQVRLAGGKGTGGEFTRGRLRSGLVIAEVALSIVLLIASGLLVRTLFALQHVDIGFNPRNVVYTYLSLPPGRYDTIGRQKVFFRTVLDRIAAIPGVIDAAETTSVPPYTRGWTTVAVLGKTRSEPGSTTFNMCTEGYFQILERHLLRGRFLSESDVESARHVAVVNQTLARDFFGKEDPVGQRIRFKDLEMYADWPRDAYFEIVGVMEDTKNHGLQDPPRPEADFPFTLITAAGPRAIIVRTALNSDSMLMSIRREISEVDSDVIVVEAGSIEDRLKNSYYVGPRFTSLTLGAFAATGLLLAVIGIFSVMAYTVTLRTHDIGVRMALGAQPDDIVRMVLRKGLVLIAAGVVLGIGASLWLTRFLASQIWGVSAADPWTFGGVVALITAVGLAACCLPACRAAQVDPLITLRYE